MIRDSRFIRELTARRAEYRAAMYRIAHEWVDLPLYKEPAIVMYLAPATDFTAMGYPHGVTLQ